MDLDNKRIKFDNKQAFGPFNIYHFTSGLPLNIGRGNAYLRGGPIFCKLYSRNSKYFRSVVCEYSIALDK